MPPRDPTPAWTRRLVRSILPSTPLICLVTDRRQLSGRVANAWLALVDQVAGAARAGADLIQIREPDLEAGPLLALTARCLEAVGGTAARVLVNDRLDVALAAGAHGVHLRAASIDAARARALAPAGFVIGRSVHEIGEARAVAAAGGVDYLVAGTLFESASKAAGHAVMGLAGFERLARGAGVPVLAIGGLTADRAPAALAAGAAGLAAIGLFLPEPDGDAGQAAARAVGALRTAFAAADSARSGKLGGDQA